MLNYCTFSYFHSSSKTFDLFSRQTRPLPRPRVVYTLVVAACTFSRGRIYRFPRGTRETGNSRDRTSCVACESTRDENA